VPVGAFKPVEFRPSGYARSRFHLPRWLVLLVTGIALGVGGVLLVQEKYLPPRLSIADSDTLRKRSAESESERQRMATQLDTNTRELKSALAEKERLASELGSGRQANERLRSQLTSLVSGLPPDPRGGVVEVRSAELSNRSGTLAYDVMITRARTSQPPLTGVLQFVVSGRNARGLDTTVPLPALPMSLDVFEHLRGQVPLPEGFVVDQASIRLLDRPDGKILGMRVMKVR
jgi:hypothetical protein